VYPSFVITQAWESPIARVLWLAGLLLNLALVGWVGFLIPSLSQVPFGFSPSGIPNEPVPAGQLILLPLLSSLIFITSLLAGLYLYRWDRERPLSFMIWFSSTLCALLFLMAVLFLVTAPA
jgi:hypothetical protein